MTGDSLDIAVNLTWLAPGRVGGSEQYLVRQLTGIAQGAGGTEIDLRLHLYCQPRFIAEHPALTSSIESTAMPLGRDVRGARILVENSWLPTVARHYDVLHNAGGTAPLVNPCPMVLTVHDLQYLRYPEYFSTLRRRYLQAMMPRSVRSAAVVAVPSHYVQGRVIEAFGVDPAKVRVVRHGLPPIEVPDREYSAVVADRYGIVGPYLAYAAITHPHKAHRRLVEMLSTTRSPSHPLHDYRLVLIGGVGAAEAELGEAIATSGVAERITRTGRVSDSDRDALIAGAEVLAFPSEYEGFGAPLVEAMALDVPVVASDHPAIVEVLGGAGVIVADTDPEAWSAAIEDAIARRGDLVRAARRRREDFTIEQSGSELGAAYRAAAGRAQELNRR